MTHIAAPVAQVGTNTTRSYGAHGFSQPSSVPAGILNGLRARDRLGVGVAAPERTVQRWTGANRDRLGVGVAARTAGVPEGKGWLRDWPGAPHLPLATREVRARYPELDLVLHRADLHALLLQRLGRRWFASTAVDPPEDSDPPARRFRSRRGCRPTGARPASRPRGPLHVHCGRCTFVDLDSR